MMFLLKFMGLSVLVLLSGLSILITWRDCPELFWLTPLGVVGVWLQCATKKANPPCD